MSRTRPRSGNIREVTIASQPTVLFPVVTSPADEPELSDADMERLEAVAGLNFTPAVRTSLRNIAAGWKAHDRLLQSPRPKDFRKRLETMRKALERVMESVDLNRIGAPVLDRHLYIWLLDGGCDGAKEMLSASDAVAGRARELITLLSAVEQQLPVDKGPSRPMDDDRFIIYLAEEFEASGGRATAYPNQHTESGYGETPFRNFVHEFYKILLLESRRTESGLDEAVRRALKYRRHSQKG